MFIQWKVLIYHCTNLLKNRLASYFSAYVLQALAHVLTHRFQEQLMQLKKVKAFPLCVAHTEMQVSVHCGILTPVMQLH